MDPDTNNPLSQIQPAQFEGSCVLPEGGYDLPQGVLPPTTSKSQLKKLKRKELWQEAQKTKKIKKKELKKLNWANKPKPQPKEGPKQPFITQKKRKEDYLEKLSKGVRVVIDLQFFSEMSDKEQNSLFRQLTHCHSQNRNADSSMKLTVSSATQEIQKLLEKKYAANNWGIDIMAHHFKDSFKQEELVYLSGDAEEVIEELEKDKVYVIGGIVDHNRLKKITYNYAVDNNLKMKRFPLLGEEIALKTNAHLAVNHVFEVMLKVQNGVTWKQAIQEAIPSRKLQE